MKADAATSDPSRMHLIWCLHVYALESASAYSALASRMIYQKQNVALLRALGDIADETAAERRRP